MVLQYVLVAVAIAIVMGLLIPYIRKRYIDKDDDKEVLTCPICKNKYPKQIASCPKCGLGGR